VDRTTFELKSTINYCGKTGLEDVGLDPAVLDAIRTFGYGIYFLIEWTRSWIVEQFRGREPETGTYMPEGV
jgi:hypothetical protein